MRREAAAALACCLAAAGARAESVVEVFGVHYESPGLVAPSAVLVLPRASGDEWRLRLTGWTVGGEWRRAVTPARSFSVAAAVTPRNAHNSNALYRDGSKEPALAYRNATVEMSAGLERRAGTRHLSAARALLLHESVGGLGTQLERRWRKPFLGLEAAHTVRRVRSEEAFGARRDGWSAGVRLRGFTGTQTFVQAQGLAAAGRRWGPFFLRSEAAGYWGHGLDTVSAFLAGGSWDLPTPGALYGYRYGEFRIERGALVSLGADLRLAGIDLGARSGALAAPGVRRSGHALRLATRWNGAWLQMGAAVPQASVRNSRERLTVFASITLAAFGSPASW